MPDFSQDRFRSIFQSSYDSQTWREVLTQFFNATELRVIPQRITAPEFVSEAFYLGNITTKDGYLIGLFHYELQFGSVVNKRVGLRNLVRSFINSCYGDFDAALVTFNSGDNWRLSFVSDIKGQETEPKRYSFVFGCRTLLYKTAVDRFELLAKNGITFASLRDAFSVEKLSDAFFEEYKYIYADFVQNITGKRFVKVGNKWEEHFDSKKQNNEKLYEAFDFDDKRVRDYIKKLLGRITFLHFLQRKGWMNNDMNYMHNLFTRSTEKDNYLDKVLEPLFFGILNTKPEHRQDLFSAMNWNQDLLTEWRNMPYLNGGLFERDAEDVPESIFPASYFARLFEFFSRYNFTIDENDPSDAEVGVDPEMLGKIFENLLEDNKDKGAFYTPKEVVRYMCNEALISYLVDNAHISEEDVRRFIICPEESVAELTPIQRTKMLNALKSVKICDPAIGSGAFPMGLLNVLVRCRITLEDNIMSRTELKKSIICNNIYGVDIEKGAVDIARLRFWLAIVVDEDTPSPLPNLDYKIMQGNSLLENFQGVDLSKLTFDPNVKKLSLHAELWDDETTTLQKSVALLMDEYYSCSDYNRKKELQSKIENLIHRQLEAKCINSTILGELKKLNLAANTDFFLWHTWFSEAFCGKVDKRGFDIVIGNPPYGANIDDMLDIYSKGFPATSRGYRDIYKHFFEFGLNIANKKGILCYITPNTYLRQTRYKDLRGLLLKNDIVKILDLGEKIFREAVVPVAIACVKTKRQVSCQKIKCSDLVEKINTENLEAVLNSVNFSSINKKEWETAHDHIFTFVTNKLKSNEITLNDVLEMKDCGFKYQRCNVGLSEKGKNDLAQRLFYNVANNAPLEHRDDIPILIGKEIFDFYHSRSPQKVLRHNYESLLKSNEKIYYNQKMMREPVKLIWRQTAPHFIGTLLKEDVFFGNTIQAGVIKEKYRDRISYEYLLGLLNSRYLRNRYEALVRETGRTFPQVKLDKLRPLPIVIPDESTRQLIEVLVTKIMNLKATTDVDTTELENTLNECVDNLYS